MHDALEAVLIQTGLERINHSKVTTDPAQPGSNQAGNQQSSNTERRVSRGTESQSVKAAQAKHEWDSPN